MITRSEQTQRPPIVWWAALKLNSPSQLIDLVRFTQKEDVNGCKCRVKTPDVPMNMCSSVPRCLAWPHWHGPMLFEKEKCLHKWTGHLLHVLFHVYKRSACPDWTKQIKSERTDASPSLSVWISLSLIRSGSRPVPVVSVEVEKVGTIFGEANLTNVTARLFAQTTADGWMLHDRMGSSL